jgi:hypothetical protein
MEFGEFALASPLTHPLMNDIEKLNYGKNVTLQSQIKLVSLLSNIDNNIPMEGIHSKEYLHDGINKMFQVMYANAPNFFKRHLNEQLNLKLPIDMRADFFLPSKEKYLKDIANQFLDQKHVEIDFIKLLKSLLQTMTKNLNNMEFHSTLKEI